MLLSDYKLQGWGARKAMPFSLILAPTRELTCQIHEEARKFCYRTGIKPVVIYGGAPVFHQLIFCQTTSFFRLAAWAHPLI
jgi:ATP-dependent RNA helicase DDX3X